MNELNHCLEEILGINFPEGTKISNATNSTDKVKEDSIFLACLGLIAMEVNISTKL